MTPRGIVFCADDFGMHEGINDACVQLVRHKRLSAVSCMTAAPAWRGDAATVAELARMPVDLGLHLDFTGHVFDAGLKHPLNTLIALAFTGRLEAERLGREIHAQLDAFESLAGRAPDHVDGHQHVHQFPMIREALLAVLAGRYPERKPWIRRTAAAHASGTPRIKPLVIQQLGCAAMTRLASQAGFAQNARLLGVYGFSGTSQDYLGLLTRWLAAAGQGDLVMCHPGHAAHGDGEIDAIAAARAREFEVLDSPAFGDLLHGQAIVPVTLSEP